MKSYILPVFSLLCFLLPVSKSFSQLNMTLQDSMDYPVGVNDVCGWVAPDGKEYALVGLNTGVSIVDINSDTIHEVAFAPGQNNTWRDINTFGHYAYVSSEAHIGLLIINLQYLPDSIQYHSWFGVCPDEPQQFNKAHSLYIDENGILYLNGSNLNNGGCVLVDVKSDPENPVCIGYSAPVYSHDCIARDSILYSAEIYPGYASIYDVHDPQHVTILGQVKTPHEFTHNISLSTDGNYMFTTDERANSYTTSYDIRDKGNIIELDRFRQAAVEGHGAIVHNVFTWQDWLVLAYYSSGTLIVDASRPDNLIEVGNFDSFIGADGNYEGVWGAYVDLPSGKILASDRTSGLFVFIPNYVRAAFLEGTVIDSISTLPISGAEVKIISDEIILPQTTKFDGTFKTGKAVPGTFAITASKEGYYTKTIQANFVNGEILTPVIPLRAKPAFSFSGRVINTQNAGIPFAKVVIFGDEGIFHAAANANGDFLMPSVYKGHYQVQAGVWGQTVQTDIQIDAPKDLTLTVLTGYYDDFDLNLGWTISGNATEGQWERGLPTEQKLFAGTICGSDTDSPFDQGIFVYSTGISTTDDVAVDEVSGGTTWLSSPSMDLDSISVLNLTFDYWLCEFPPNENHGFKVWLSNSEDTTLIKHFENNNSAGSWERFGTQTDFEGPRNNVKILFSASDTTAGTGDYYLKVHVDNFNVTEGANGTHDNWISAKHFLIYPNPVDGSTIYLKPENNIEGNELSLQISDMQGRIISSEQIAKSDAEYGINHKLNDGFYFLQWRTEKGEYGVEKIVVLKN